MTKLNKISNSNQVNIGDVIRFNKEGCKKYGYGLVVRKEDRDGFYYVRCNRYAQINYSLDPSTSPANYIEHSNMLLGDVVVIFSHIQLTNQYGMPSIGISAIDNYLALLDKRHTVFLNNAPKEMTDLFRNWEDKNLHAECGLMVAKWYEQHLLGTVRNNYSPN